MKQVLIFLCVLAVVAIASPAWATTWTFTDADPTDSKWSTPGNWDQGTVPVYEVGVYSGSTVVIGNNKTCILDVKVGDPLDTTNYGTLRRLYAGNADEDDNPLLGTLQIDDGAYLRLTTYSRLGASGPGKIVQYGGEIDFGCNMDWPWNGAYSSTHELHGGTFKISYASAAHWLMDGDGGNTMTCAFTQDGGTYSNVGKMEIAVGSLNDSTAIYTISDGTASVDVLSIMRKGAGGSGASGTGTGILNVVGSKSTITIGTYLQANPGAGLDAILECEIDAGGITTIIVTGTATFEAGCLLDMEIASGVTLTPGQPFDLMTAPDGGITGLPTLKAEDVGTWTVAVVSGSDILRATYVPEPATLTLLGLGGLGVLIRRKRR